MNISMRVKLREYRLKISGISESNVRYTVIKEEIEETNMGVFTGALNLILLQFAFHIESRTWQRQIRHLNRGRYGAGLRLEELTQGSYRYR